MSGEAKQVPGGSLFPFCRCGGRKEDGGGGSGPKHREVKKGESPGSWPTCGAALEGVPAARPGRGSAGSGGSSRSSRAWEKTGEVQTLTHPNRTFLGSKILK
jgi:hypothetical protein